MKLVRALDVLSPHTSASISIQQRSYCSALDAKRQLNFMLLLYLTCCWWATVEFNAVT